MSIQTYICTKILFKPSTFGNHSYKWQYKLLVFYTAAFDGMMVFEKPFTSKCCDKYLNLRSVTALTFLRLLVLVADYYFAAWTLPLQIFVNTRKIIFFSIIYLYRIETNSGLKLSSVEKIHVKYNLL